MQNNQEWAPTEDQDQEVVIVIDTLEETEMTERGEERRVDIGTEVEKETEMRERGNTEKRTAKGRETIQRMKARDMD